MIRTQQDALRALETYTGHDARLSADIEALLSEPPERQAPILNLVMRLARGVPRMGPLLAFEIINALAQKSAEAEITDGKNALPTETPA